MPFPFLTFEHMLFAQQKSSAIDGKLLIKKSYSASFKSALLMRLLCYPYTEL